MAEENRIERIEAIIESNARAIEALTNTFREEREERRREQTRLYQAMANMADGMAQMSERVSAIASAQSSLWEVQADYYRRLEEMDERQSRILEILDRVTQK